MFSYSVEYARGLKHQDRALDALVQPGDRGGLTCWPTPVTGVEVYLLSLSGPRKRLTGGHPLLALIRNNRKSADDLGERFGFI